MKNQTFKVGDKVYCPEKGINVFTLQANQDDYNYPLMINSSETFTKNGIQWKERTLPSIIHATEENHKKLCDLYGVEFEAPPKQKEPKEIIKAMLDDGWIGVPCFVSDEEERPTNNDQRDYITELDKDRYPFKGSNTIWYHAIPFDPKTGKVIVDYVDGQPILE